MLLPENDVSLVDWVLGFWTGMNADAFKVGSTSDARGIVGEVKLVCQAQPSTTLATATYETYQRLKAERR